MQHPPFGPDMRDVQFKADRERELDAEADAGTGVSEDADSGELHLSAQGLDRILAHMRKRWMWMAAMQAVVIVPLTCVVMSTQYQPGGPLAAPEFMGCVLMMAGASLSIGWCGYASVDPNRYQRMQLAAIAANAPLFPLAALLAWCVSMLMFRKFLHGWDPGYVRWLVANPFGILLFSWVLSFFLLRFLLMPLLMPLYAAWLRMRMQVQTRKVPVTQRPKAGMSSDGG